MVQPEVKPTIRPDRVCNECGAEASKAHDPGCWTGELEGMVDELKPPEKPRGKSDFTYVTEVEDVCPYCGWDEVGGNSPGRDVTGGVYAISRCLNDACKRRWRENHMLTGYSDLDADDDVLSEQLHEQSVFDVGAWCYLQQGGSTKEIYIHWFDTLEQANAGMASARGASYETSGPFRLPGGFTEVTMNNLIADLIKEAVELCV